MYGYLLAVGIATTVFAAVVSYAMARRYGWAAALALPGLALVTMIALRRRDEGLEPGDGMQMVGMGLVFSAPVLLGVAVGIVTAWWRGRREG